MLSRAQRWVVFILTCLFALACVAAELYLLYSIVHDGFTNVKAASSVLSAGILFLFGRGFWKLSSKTFLEPSITSPDRLHRFASERCRIIENARVSGEDIYRDKRILITNTLKFSEECLRGWIPGSHFELCVFLDQEQPLLFAYFDSNHDDTARSMREREGNPRFYVERGYEVSRLLQTPTSKPRILKDTTKVNYVFTSNEQRAQLKSSILLCLDVATPCALVITSNSKSAFSEGESDVISFIKYIGETVRYDLIDQDFLHRIRMLRPALFAVDPH